MLNIIYDAVFWTPVKSQITGKKKNSTQVITNDWQHALQSQSYLYLYKLYAQEIVVVMVLE